MIVINVDTEKQTIKTSVNDKNIPDVQDIYIHSYIPYDSKDNTSEIMVDIVSGTRDEENNITRTLTTTCRGSEISETDTLTNDLAEMLKISKKS
jgi:hypothetical protein